jgi:hypothetical protein
VSEICKQGLSWYSQRTILEGFPVQSQSHCLLPISHTHGLRNPTFQGWYKKLALPHNLQLGATLLIFQLVLNILYYVRRIFLRQLIVHCVISKFYTFRHSIFVCLVCPSMNESELHCIGEYGFMSWNQYVLMASIVIARKLHKCRGIRDMLRARNSKTVCFPPRPVLKLRFFTVCEIRTNNNLWQDSALLISLVCPPADLEKLLHSYTYCTIFIYPICLLNFIRKF